MVSIAIFIIAGILAGIGIGLVGLSAATIITPMLVVLLGMNAYKAIGISLAADVLSAGVSAYTYYKNKNIDIKNGIVMMISTMIFTWLASSLAKDIPNNILGGVTIYTTLLLGLKLIFKPIGGKEDNKASKRSKGKQILLSIVCGAAIGIICGAIGVGGGIMLLLVLTSILGYDLKTAVGTSVFIMAFTAMTGAVAHIANGGTDIVGLVVCGVFALISSRMAAKFANKIDDVKLNKISGIFLIAFAVILLVIKYFGHVI